MRAAALLFISLFAGAISGANAAPLAAAITQLDGKYSDYILSKMYAPLFPATLVRDRKLFAERLETVSPVEMDGKWYFGSGCEAHQCTVNESAWTIDPDKQRLSVIILVTWPAVRGGAPSHISFLVYGTSLQNMPAPLLAWAKDLGMNPMNVAVVAPEYVPPVR